MAEHETFRVPIDAQGRLVPAEARRALGAEPGETLVLTVPSRGRLVLETRAALVARLQRTWARRVPSVNDLLEQRREDARREAAREADRLVHR